MSINDADDEEERVHVSGAVPVVRPYRLVDADDDEGDDALEPLLDGSSLARDAPLLRTHWETILVVLPLFAGCACWWLRRGVAWRAVLCCAVAY